MKLINFIFHMFGGCPDEDLVEEKRGKMKCSKCEREYFVFKTY